MQEYYTIRQVAEEANIHPNTIKRWIREGRISETKERGHNGMRIFTVEEKQAVVSFVNQVIPV